MALFQWDDSLATGIESIDIQHKELFRIVSNLHNGIEEGREDFPLIDVLEVLNNYVRYHFRHEESILDECGYDDLDNHRAQHEEFAERIAHFDLSQADDKGQIRRDIQTFLQDWLVSHIQSEDMCYVPCLKAKNAK